MKIDRNTIIIFIFLLLLTIIITTLLGVFIRQISIWTLLFTIILSSLLSNQKRRSQIKRIILKLRKDFTTNQSSLPRINSRNDAARQSLRSIKKLSNLIQNEIDAKGLYYEQKRIEKEFLRGDLLVVVLGSGASGKTSLIRALLKRIVGNVGPNIGTTKRIRSYRMKLANLQRGVMILDTPGLLEGGVEGRLRENESLSQASKADLIIYVADSDLRSFELDIIYNLVKVGKKLFIALNKSDLLGEDEERRLLTIVRNHCKGLINSENIFNISASPQSIPVIGSKPLQPKAKISNLIKRMSMVLHKEGEELIADNILLQCQNLGASGKRILEKQRLIEAERCVERYVWITTGVVFVTPLPGVDLLGLAVVNWRMVKDISKTYGVEITTAKAKDLALSVGKTLGGLGIVKGGISLISNGLSLHLPTFVISKSLQSITAGWLTKVAGDSFVTYFKQDQDWGDGGIQEVVQHHYKLNRRESVLKKFLNAAMNRIIDPPDELNKKQLPARLKLPEEEEAWLPENQE